MQKVEDLATIGGNAEWVRLAKEQWLKWTILRLMARETTWGNVSAGALLSRASGVSADPAVVDERVAQPRRWARSWSPEECRTVRDLAVARACRIEDDLAQDNFDVDTLEEREILQGVAALLWEANSLGDLPEVLAALDARGRELAQLGFLDLPLQGVSSDILNMAALLSPGEWWAPR